MVEEPHDPNKQTNSLEEDEFLRERMERWGAPRRPPTDPFFPRRPRKSKWLAGLLSFLIPGTGQLYLGLMQRGLSMMLLMMLDIVAIVFFAVKGVSNIPLIVLFSLFVPVIYFYNIFDALQQTDRVNGDADDFGYRSAFDPGGQDFPRSPGPSDRPIGRLSKGGGFGYLLIGAGVLLFFIHGKPAWMDRVLEVLGSSVGAVVLIVIGVYMFYIESIKK
ncbi:hypothetical protein O9H85_36955 [Paenibacillus filicis]|uniref:TM2 domain-containing protein n=1 Tax=Paenibacillus gyeongsangnamensis TaxID=3388067 RepID=A0ABT4QLR3_9BACL|nr:hypothetical protein [Paenibacillus filicis]MCZ8517784.1 hypothetical protein [Paenibacillus filicis]